LIALSGFRAVVDCLEWLQGFRAVVDCHERRAPRGAVTSSRAVLQEGFGLQGIKALVFGLQSISPPCKETGARKNRDMADSCGSQMVVCVSAGPASDGGESLRRRPPGQRRSGRARRRLGAHPQGG
jgi:hypothetical protein